MTYNAWSMVEFSARLLSRNERDAVLGDFLEAGEAPWKALFGVLGLAMRRRLMLWKSWRPWFAAFGLSLPCSLLLMYVSISVICTLERLLGFHLGHWAPTGHEGFLMLLCHIFLLITWSWTSGFAASSLSPRTLCWNAAVCLLVGTRFISMHTHFDPVSPYYSLLFVGPAIWGVRQGRRMLRLPLRHAVALAATMTLLMTWAWTSNALWVFNWLLLYPAWYLVATARTVPYNPTRQVASSTR
jgi:hypothetical protein